jgi:hypothetical protein
LACRLRLFVPHGTGEPAASVEIDGTSRLDEHGTDASTLRWLIASATWSMNHTPTLRSSEHWRAGPPAQPLAQALEASLSTAGHPKNCGLNVSLRYPAGWNKMPAEHAVGLFDFGQADNSVVMSLWISDRDMTWPAATEREQALPEMYRDALWSVLERFVPEGCRYERAVTAVAGSLPAAKIYFRSDALNGQVVGFVYERRVVMLWSMCRGAAAGRFDELKPLFQGVLDSVSVGVDERGMPIGWIAGAAIATAVVLGFAVHWIRTRYRTVAAAEEPRRRRKRK